MASVELRDIRKSYAALDVIHGISLDIADGEFIALVGPSGCGKSTLLRMIAGLEEITDGDILIGDKVVNGMTPRERNIAMVFQSYALYPHMTVAENMGFNLKLAGQPKNVIEERVAEAARMLDLGKLLDRKPSQLSGGQRQRVAMGRAVVRNPAVFLFDEPLSNLDAKLRVQMRSEIKALHQKVGTTSIYVTHDQIEAMTLADRVVVLNHGRIEQQGTPLELSVVEQPMQGQSGRLLDYERLLGDAMMGDATLFARQDLVETAWSFVEPALARDLVVHQYEPQSWGPREAERLVAGTRGWQTR